MILNYQHWLPDNAILDGQLKTKFQAVVERWGVKWFGKSDSFSISLELMGGNEEIEDSSLFWSNDAEGLSVSIKTSDAFTLAQKLLNFDVPNGNINATDELFFEHIIKECVEDLQSGLRKDFLLTGEFKPAKDKPYLPTFNSSDYLLCITAHDVLAEIKISIPKNLLSAVRKASLGPDTSEPLFGLIEDAINEQIVGLGARVGTGAINLLDVENLAKGDVLILESDITDSINVTINKRVIAELNCQIVQDTKTDNLKITQLMMDETQ